MFFYRSWQRPSLVKSNHSQFIVGDFCRDIFWGQYGSHFIIDASLQIVLICCISVTPWLVVAQLWISAFWVVLDKQYKN